MQRQAMKLIPEERERRLKWIVVAHLLVVVTFFVTVFFWGNFA